MWFWLRRGSSGQTAGQEPRGMEGAAGRAPRDPPAGRRPLLALLLLGLLGAAVAAGKREGEGEWGASVGASLVPGVPLGRGCPAPPVGESGTLPF